MLLSVYLFIYGSPRQESLLIIVCFVDAEQPQVNRVLPSATLSSDEQQVRRRQLIPLFFQQPTSASIANPKINLIFEFVCGRVISCLQ